VATLAETPSAADSAATDAASPAARNIYTFATALKPRLRGWIHAGTTPLALAAGIVLIVLSPATAGKVAAVVFMVTSLLLFGTSAVYHRGNWSPRITAFLRRWDHSNIFLIIAGTYTPLAVLMLEPSQATTLLLIVWGGALAGVMARVFWLSAPRWFYVPVYVALGWVAVAYMGPLRASGGLAVVWLIVAGGIAYTLGAVIYGTKFPNPSPRWFGFHEIFHVFTVVGYACHTIAIFMAAVRR